MKISIVVAVLFTVLLCFGSVAQATFDSSKHEYGVIRVKQGITWEQAVEEVNTSMAGWHLLTITSQAEQIEVGAFLGGLYGEYWMGGYQDGTSLQWITGEDSSGYDHFSPYQTTSGSAGQRVSMYNAIGTHSWLYRIDSTVLRGYLIEREINVSSVPVPAAIWLFGGGLFTIGGFRFSRRLTGCLCRNA